MQNNAVRNATQRSAVVGISLYKRPTIQYENCLKRYKICASTTVEAYEERIQA